MRHVRTRADDELLLAWLALPAGGMSSYKIAQSYGVSSERVRTATHRVLEDDLAHSCRPAPRDPDHVRECPSLVRSHYWAQSGAAVRLGAVT